MDKMTIYESARGVPEEARKSISGGRLQGMTDINPMWRVKKLTELFGPAGIGWRFDPPIFEEKPGVNGEIMVHCCTNLYIRQLHKDGISLLRNLCLCKVPNTGMNNPIILHNKAFIRKGYLPILEFF